MEFFNPSTQHAVGRDDQDLPELVVTVPVQDGEGIDHGLGLTSTRLKQECSSGPPFLDMAHGKLDALHLMLIWTGLELISRHK